MAAANPIGGHYNKAKTVSENLKCVDVHVYMGMEGALFGVRVHCEGVWQLPYLCTAVSWDQGSL